MKANDYAIVIGIDDYEDDIGRLEAARNDAKAFRNWLINIEGGKLPEENCKIILSTNDPRNPNQDLIDKEIKTIYNIAKDNKGGRFYFYFSGHGFGLDLETNALLAADWSFDFNNRALNSKEYVKYIQESGLFKEIVFLFDCCRNRNISCNGRVPSFSRARPQEGASKCDRFIAYATEYDDFAYEDLSEPEGISHGYFTKALIQGLKEKEAADPLLKKITANSLKSYLIRKTRELASLEGKRQHAKIENGFSDDESSFGEITQDKVTLKIKFLNERDNTVVLLNSSMTEVSRTDNTTEIWEVEVDIENHYIREVNDNNFFQIEVNPGKKEIDVEF